MMMRGQVFYLHRINLSDFSQFLFADAFKFACTAGHPTGASLYSFDSCTSKLLCITIDIVSYYRRISSYTPGSAKKRLSVNKKCVIIIYVFQLKITQG